MYDAFVWEKDLITSFFRKNQTPCTNIFLPLLPDENKFHAKNGIIYIFIRDKMEDPICSNRFICYPMVFK